MARVTGLEPATSGVTGRHSNQLSYTRIPLREEEKGRIGATHAAVKRRALLALKKPENQTSGCADEVK